MDVEGGWARRILDGVEDGPVVLDDAAVARAIAEECWQLGAVTTNAEVADGLLRERIVEEIEQGGVCEVRRFRFVQEHEVEAGRAEIAEAAFQRGAGFFGNETGFGWRRSSSACGAGEAFERRDASQKRADGAADSAEEAPASRRIDAELGSDGNLRMAG